MLTKKMAESIPDEEVQEMASRYKTTSGTNYLKFNAAQRVLYRRYQRLSKAGMLRPRTTAKPVTTRPVQVVTAPTRTTASSDPSAQYLEYLRGVRDQINNTINAIEGTQGTLSNNW